MAIDKSIAISFLKTLSVKNATTIGPSPYPVIFTVKTYNPDTTPLYWFGVIFWSEVANKARGSVIKKLVVKIPIKTVLELRVKNVMGPTTVRAIAVTMQTTIVAAFTFNLVKYFSITGPDYWTLFLKFFILYLIIILPCECRICATSMHWFWNSDRIWISFF